MKLKFKYSKIEIKKGLIKDKGLPEGLVITDTNVAKNYKSLIGENSIEIAPGEKSKSGEIYLLIASSYKLENCDKIIAFGGGVVGDLSGFLSSTYKRGINFVQVPTTLLAMVDSSIGGKNGINLGRKKNYLGTIYQPEKILIDPCFLETLPLREFKNGLAEIIKYSSVFGKPSLERLEKGVSLHDADLEEIIFQCCEIKANVVEQDEQDKESRHTLNFGHTIGHAIELLYNLNHGEAISIGMLKELKLGERLGIVSKNKLDKIKRVLNINSLSAQLPNDHNTEKILKIIKHDKKGNFVFAFNKENYNTRVNEELVREVLTKC